MGTIADKLNLLLNTKAAIKAAIISKGQSVWDSDAFSTYPDKIQAIETSVQLPTLTNPGTAADLLAGKQLIDADGNVIEGTTPAYYTSIITPCAGGNLIEAPKYISEDLTIQGDANLISENIKSGVSIFGVNGTLSNEIEYERITSISSATVSQTSFVVNSTTYRKIVMTITLQSSAKSVVSLCGTFRGTLSENGNSYNLINGIGGFYPSDGVLNTSSVTPDAIIYFSGYGSTSFVGNLLGTFELSGNQITITVEASASTYLLPSALAAIDMLVGYIPE